jgi:glycosyltransferase involved in cell wall biosynthesis
MSGLSAEPPERAGDARDVTVVISTLDRPALLARCLDALAAGRRRPAAVVVVDQGDPSPVDDVVAARAGALEIRHVVQTTRGLSVSQNAGVAAARTRIVAVIDDDCVPDEHWIELVADTFAEPEPPTLLAGRILPLPPEGTRTVAVSSRTSEVEATHRWPVEPWVIGSGGSFAVVRDRYLEVGGNDERLGTGSPGRGGNDMDLFYRLLRAGGTARYDPRLLVHHERSTVEERRARRGSYGFGVGAAVGRWVRDGDRWAWRALARWLVLRARTLRRSPSAAALADELRIFGGTVSGLWYGLRLGAPWGP